MIEKLYGPLNILTQKEVANVLGLCVASIQKMRKTPGFPKRRSFGGGPKGWLFSDIETWAKSAPADESDDSEDTP